MMSWRAGLVATVLLACAGTFSAQGQGRSGAADRAGLARILALFVQQSNDIAAVTRRMTETDE